MAAYVTGKGNSRCRKLMQTPLHPTYRPSKDITAKSLCRCKEYKNKHNIGRRRATENVITYNDRFPIYTSLLENRLIVAASNDRASMQKTKLPSSKYTPKQAQGQSKTDKLTLYEKKTKVKKLNILNKKNGKSSTGSSCHRVRKKPKSPIDCKGFVKREASMFASLKLNLLYKEKHIACMQNSAIDEAKETSLALNKDRNTASDRPKSNIIFLKAAKSKLGERKRKLEQIIADNSDAVSFTRRVASLNAEAIISASRHPWSNNTSKAARTEASPIKVAPSESDIEYKTDKSAPSVVQQGPHWVDGTGEEYLKQIPIIQWSNKSFMPQSSPDSGYSQSVTSNENISAARSLYNNDSRHINVMPMNSPSYQAEYPDQHNIHVPIDPSNTGVHPCHIQIPSYTASVEPCAQQRQFVTGAPSLMDPGTYQSIAAPMPHYAYANPGVGVISPAEQCQSYTLGGLGSLSSLQMMTYQRAAAYQSAFTVPCSPHGCTGLCGQVPPHTYNQSASCNPRAPYYPYIAPGGYFTQSTAAASGTMMPPIPDQCLMPHQHHHPSIPQNTVRCPQAEVKVLIHNPHSNRPFIPSTLSGSSATQNCNQIIVPVQYAPRESLCNSDQPVRQQQNNDVIIQVVSPAAAASPPPLHPPPPPPPPLLPSSQLPTQVPITHSIESLTPCKAKKTSTITCSKPVIKKIKPEPKVSGVKSETKIKSKVKSDAERSVKKQAKISPETGLSKSKGGSSVKESKAKSVSIKKQTCVNKECTVKDACILKQNSVNKSSTKTIAKSKPSSKKAISDKVTQKKPKNSKHSDTKPKVKVKKVPSNAVDGKVGVKRKPVTKKPDTGKTVHENDDSVYVLPSVPDTVLPVHEVSENPGWTWQGEAETKQLPTLVEGVYVERKCFPSIVHSSGDVIKIRDCILLCSGSRKTDLPYVAKIMAFWEDVSTGDKMMTLLWYYRPEHIEGGSQPHHLNCELFASKHRDESHVACIEDRAYVLTYNEYCRYECELRRIETDAEERRNVVPDGEEEEEYSRQEQLPSEDNDPETVFVCRQVYDFRQKRIVKNPS